MKSVIPRAVLLVAPVIETLQRQLAEHFPLLRLYEQDDPIAFLREQGENIAVVVTRGDVGVANSVLELLPQAGLIAIFGVGTMRWIWRMPARGKLPSPSPPGC